MDAEASTNAYESNPSAIVRDWKLEPETEYRFELDPGTSLAIKVCLDSRPALGMWCSGRAVVFVCNACYSLFKVRQRFSERNLRMGRCMFSVRNARPQCSPGRDAPYR